MIVGLCQGTDRHAGFVFRRCLCLTRARASQVDSPLLTRRGLKTRPEGATALTRRDHAAAITRLSSDEVPAVFAHFGMLARGPRRATDAVPIVSPHRLPVGSVGSGPGPRFDARLGDILDHAAAISTDDRLHELRAVHAKASNHQCPETAPSGVATRGSECDVRRTDVKLGPKLSHGRFRLRRFQKPGSHDAHLGEIVHGGDTG